MVLIYRCSVVWYMLYVECFGRTGNYLLVVYTLEGVYVTLLDL